MSNLDNEKSLPGEIWRGAVPYPFMSGMPTCAVVLEGCEPVAMVNRSTMSGCSPTGWQPALRHEEGRIFAAWAMDERAKGGR